MKKTLSVRLTAIILAAMLLLGNGALVFGAEKSVVPNENMSTEIKEVIEIMGDLQWLEYMEKYSSMPKASATAVFKAADCYTFADEEKDEERTYSYELDVLSELDGRSNILQLPDGGTAAFKISVPESGIYALDIDYYPLLGKATNIERTLRINGKVPFNQLRNLVMTKIWIDNPADYIHDESGAVVLNENGNPLFETDENGNEIRPEKIQSPEWITYTVSDPTGFYDGEFWFYLEAGENTISLEYQREAVAIDTLTIRPTETELTYAEYIKQYENVASAPADAVIKLQAEYATKTSDRTIYPLNDRTSAISEPQDPTKTVLNSIGGTKWQTLCQWIEYDFEITEPGMYTISPRYLQNAVDGIFVSRRVYIDGQIPFAEANDLQFMYDSEWRLENLNDGTTDFEFYFEKGMHTVRFEVSYGNFAKTIQTLQTSLTKINDIYLLIVQMCGTDPSADTEYGFYKAIPEAIDEMLVQSTILSDLANEMNTLSGLKGSSSSATLLNVARVLEKMGRYENEIARNLKALKSYIGSLGTLMNNLQNQSLTFDYIVIQSPDNKLPKANSNFFQDLWYETKAFIMSFFTDYSSFTMDTGENVSSVEVWVASSTVAGLSSSSGRDQAQIIRQLIDENLYAYTHEQYGTGIIANLKLVAAGTLLPATLSGKGPDIMMTTGQSDVVNYAIRGAIKRLNDFEGFSSVIERFSEAAMVPLTLYGDTYGVPETQAFPMMFYRKDILAQKGLEIPRTWTQYQDVIETLMADGYVIGFPSGSGGDATGFYMFLYQKGGNVYSNNGMTIAFDENVALEAFTEYTSLFVNSTFPVTYDAANRFRTGEMPLLIADYVTFFNQFTIFATELKGLWGFTVIPGYEQSDGSIINTAPTSVTAMVMMKDADNPEAAWKYMDWWTSTRIQGSYSNELVALLGPSGKYATANVEALFELPWTAKEIKNIKAQFENLKGTPEMPGGYIISRYIKFAFNAVYNNRAVPAETLLGYVDEINKEITRKRKEFDLEVSPLYE